MTAHISNLSALPTTFSFRSALPPLRVSAPDILAKMGVQGVDEQSAQINSKALTAAGDGTTTTTTTTTTTPSPPCSSSGLLSSADFTVDVSPSTGSLAGGETKELVVSVLATRSGLLPPHMLVFDIDGVKRPLPLAIAAEVRGVSLSYEVGAHTYTPDNGPPAEVDLCTVARLPPPVPLPSTAATSQVQSRVSSHKPVHLTRALGSWSGDVTAGRDAVRQPSAYVQERIQSAVSARSKGSGGAGAGVFAGGARGAGGWMEEDVDEDEDEAGEDSNGLVAVFHPAVVPSTEASEAVALHSRKQSSRRGHTGQTRTGDSHSHSRGGSGSGGRAGAGASAAQGRVSEQRGRRKLSRLTSVPDIVVTTSESGGGKQGPNTKDVTTSNSSNNSSSSRDSRDSSASWESERGMQSTDNAAAASAAAAAREEQEEDDLSGTDDDEVKPFHHRGLAFGSVKVRKPTFKLLRLYNHSSIDATLHASVHFFPAPRAVREQVHSGGIPAGGVEASAAANKTATTKHAAEGAVQTRRLPQAPATSVQKSNSNSNSGSNSGSKGRAFKRSVRSVKASLKQQQLGRRATRDGIGAALQKHATMHGACFFPEEESVRLEPHSCAVLKVWCYADVWGEYTDQLVLTGEHLDTVHIPLHATASGCALVPLVSGTSALSPLVRLPSLALHARPGGHAGAAAATAAAAADSERQQKKDGGNEGEEGEEATSTMRKVSVRNPTSQPLVVLWEALDVNGDDTRLVDVLSRFVADDPLQPNVERDGRVKLRSRVHEGNPSRTFSVHPHAAVIFPEQTSVFEVRFSPRTFGTFNAFVRAQVVRPEQAGLPLSPTPSTSDVLAFFDAAFVARARGCGDEQGRLPPFAVETLVVDRSTATLRGLTRAEGGQLQQLCARQPQQQQQQQQHATPQGEQQQQEQQQQQRRRGATGNDGSGAVGGAHALRDVAGVVRRQTLEYEDNALTIQVTAQAEHPLLQVVGAPESGVVFELSSDEVLSGRKSHSTSFTLHNPTASRISFVLGRLSEFQVGVLDVSTSAPALPQSKSTATMGGNTLQATAQRTQHSATKLAGSGALLKRDKLASPRGGLPASTVLRMQTANLGAEDLAQYGPEQRVVLEPGQSCSVGVRWAVKTVNSLIARGRTTGKTRHMSLQERPRLFSVVDKSLGGADTRQAGSSHHNSGDAGAAVDADADADRDETASRASARSERTTATIVTTTGEEKEEGGARVSSATSTTSRASRASGSGRARRQAVRYQPTAVSIADQVRFKIEGSGEDLCVPVRAVLHIPHLRLREERLDFGQSVLGEPLMKTVTIINSGTETNDKAEWWWWLRWWLVVVVVVEYSAEGQRIDGS